MVRYLTRWKPIDVEEIAPLIVTYRPTKLPSATALHREMLKPVPNPAALSPDAPNRSAVEHNLRESIRSFESVFRDFARAGAAHRLTSWQDLLRLNIRHVTGAERHYTNGQATVTCVGTDGGLSVALHSDMELQSDFRPSFAASALDLVTDERQARSLAARWLAEAEERDVPVLVDGKPQTLKWRTWGAVPGPHGYRTRGLVLTVAGHSVWTQLDDCPGARFEAYAVVNRLPKILPGVEADTCATCRSFRFSGMSRDMSGGRIGYCMCPTRASGAGQPTVSVLDRCDEHSTIRDADREHPFLR